MILLVSRGRLRFQFSPTTLRRGEVLQRGEGKAKRQLAGKGGSASIKHRVLMLWLCEGGGGTLASSSRGRTGHWGELFLEKRLKKPDQNKLTDSELFALLANPRNRSCPPPPRISGFILFFLLRIPGKSFSLPYDAATDTEVPGFDTDICTSKAAGEAARKQHQWKTTSFLFFSLRHTPAPIRGIRRRGGRKKKRRCCCCIFNRAARFNPTLTFKAQGLIPSLVKAFV